MKVFWDPAQQAHAPEFFLQKGKVRKNFEIPARADALLEACTAMKLDIVAPPEADLLALRQVHTPDYLGFLRDGPIAWAALPDPGEEVVANIHPTPEMLANGARRSSTIIGQVGWYTADAACPVTAHTFPAAVRAIAELARARHQSVDQIRVEDVERWDARG